ncbi:hypothetical protein XENTR_v10013286 [Xenopus tropicalis]|nr:hypothetical protein XENTR_v10013286 [Xenopus tropicalis]
MFISAFLKALPGFYLLINTKQYNINCMENSTTHGWVSSWEVPRLLGGFSYGCSTNWWEMLQAAFPRLQLLVSEGTLVNSCSMELINGTTIRDGAVSTPVTPPVCLRVCTP